jgi:exopolysaccharide biosynthesis WecB/TagA/CpsF family protein
MKKETILNVAFDNYTEQELLENLKEGVLVTPNVDHIVKMQKDKTFYDIVKQADFVVCDSKIVYLASKFLGRPLPEAIPGSGFFPHFYMYHKEDEHCKIFLLGGLDGVAQKAQKNINEKVGRGMVVGAYSPSFGFEKKPEENEQIYKMINDSCATVVLVGVGCPKQEKWIDAHKLKMHGVKIWMALGATIDFEAGNIKRAPKIFQKLALEWLYRLCSEPKRLWRRYLIDDTRFFWLLLKDKMGTYRNPFEY